MKPEVIAISGVKNSGKTTFIENLLPCLKRQGLRVAVIKHDGHEFEPDVPGTDSWRMRSAGAEGIAVYSETTSMIIKTEPVGLEELTSQFIDYDLILLEGQKYSDYPKIELIRSGISSQSICKQNTLLAIATDLDIHLSGVTRIGLNDYEQAACLILKNNSNKNL